MNMYGIRNNPYEQTYSIRTQERRVQAQEEKQAREAEQALNPDTVPIQRPADRDRYEPGAMPDEPDKAEKPPRSEKKEKTERCVGNTDKVDQEIEKLKKKKQELKQQINAAGDPEKAEKLEKELARVENELRQKDNDGYRRSHTVFSSF